MKYTSKMYATALVQMISGRRDGAQVKKDITGFLDFLAKNGDMKKAREIIGLAEDIFYKKTDKRKIILEIARKIEKKNLLKDFFQPGDMVQEKINPELVAGIKVMIKNDKQLDFSLKNKLDNIFN